MASSAIVRTDSSLCRRQSLLGPEVHRQAHLSVQKAGLGLTSNSAIAAAAYIGCQSMVFRRVITAVSACGLSALLEHLPERLLAQRLIVALVEVEEITT